MAGIAADPVVDLDAVRNASPLVHSILALVLLIAATVLAIYKPFGMTPFGMRKQHTSREPVPPAALASRASGAESGTPGGWTYLFGVIAIGIVLLFLLLHFLRGGLPGH